MQGCEQHMYMICHKYPCVHLYSEAESGSNQVMRVGRVIVGRSKADLTIVTALYQMQRNSGRADTWKARHGIVHDNQNDLS